MSAEHEVKGWRAVPPALALACVIEIVWLVAYSIHQSVDDEWYMSARWLLSGTGVAFVAYLLGAYGFMELSKRLTGRAALCVRVASWAMIGKLVLTISFGLLMVKVNIGYHRWLIDVRQYAWFVLHTGLVVSLAIAVLPTRRGLAILAIASACLLDPPPFLGKELYGWLDLGYRNFILFDAGLRLVIWVLIAMLVVTVAIGAPRPEPELAVIGLRRAARSLWLRVIAAVTIVAVTLLVVGGRGESGVPAMKLAMITGLIVNVIALLQLALGLLAVARSSIADLPRIPLVIAAGLSMFYTGIMFGQLPQMYRLLYGSDSRSGLEDSLKAWSIGGPIMAIASLAIVASAIRAFASRRSFHALREQAAARGFWFVLLMLGSVLMQAWLLPTASSAGAFIFLTLAAAGCGFGALVMMAKLCTLAADSIGRQPGLPTATAISGGGARPAT